jgi:hypothetical protein
MIAVIKGPAGPLALGLRWEELLGAKRPQAEATEIAKRQSARIGVLAPGITTGRYLVGLVLERGGRTPSAGTTAYSGAAWLAQSVSEPTIVCHHLSDSRFWIAVIPRPGAVAIDSDQVLEAGPACARLEGALEAFGMAGVTPALIISGDVVPDADIFKDRPYEQINLDAVLGRSAPSNTRLRQLVGVSTSIKLAVAAVGIAAAGAVAFGIMLERQKAQEAYIAEVGAEEAVDYEVVRQQRIEAAVQEALVQHTQTPEPALVMVACEDALVRSGLVVDGWRVQEMECDVAGRVATVTYQRSAGWATNDALLRAFERADGVAFTLSASGMEAVASLPVYGLVPRAPLDRDALPGWIGILRDVGSPLQTLAFASRQAVPVSSAIGEPAPAEVTYLEPSMERSEGPERFQPVPADRSFRIGSLTVTGAGSLLHAINLDEPYVSVTRVRFRMAGVGFRFSFVVEGAYVASSS